MLSLVAESFSGFSVLGFARIITNMVDWLILALSLYWVFFRLLRKPLDNWQKVLPAILIPVYIAAISTLILKILISKGWPGPLTIFWFKIYLPFPIYSFPSGHTSRAFALATSLGSKAPAWGVVFFLIAFIIGFSRIILGVHDIYDIAAGMILGVLASLIYEKWTFKDN